MHNWIKTYRGDFPVAHAIILRSSEEALRKTALTPLMTHSLGCVKQNSEQKTRVRIAASGDHPAWAYVAMMLCSEMEQITTDEKAPRAYRNWKEIATSMESTLSRQLSSVMYYEFPTTK